mmetsp:Transcript_44604/g.103010  ORF Transcript_44604/g.103010 Transcript_44604/m.103010 type:complete len:210 (+) Transcript_44604:728-1357(+)
MRSFSNSEPMMSHFASPASFCLQFDHAGGLASFPLMKKATNARNSAQTPSLRCLCFLVLNSTASSIKRSRSESSTAVQADSFPNFRSSVRCAAVADLSCKRPSSSALVKSSLKISRALRFTVAVCFRLSLSIFLANDSKRALRAFWPGTAVNLASYISLGSHVSYLSKGFTPFSTSICLNFLSMSFSLASRCSSATFFALSSSSVGFFS